VLKIAPLLTQSYNGKPFHIWGIRPRQTLITGRARSVPISSKEANSICRPSSCRFGPLRVLGNLAPRLKCPAIKRNGVTAGTPHPTLCAYRVASSLSPGNVKILDFGLAKLAQSVAISNDDMAANTDGVGKGARSIDPVLSRPGVMIGTAAYMSPEQVRGEKLDARTDLFSFGLVLYEMATGQRAFVGDTGPVLQASIVSQSPRPMLQLNRNLPAKFESIVSKALEKDRETRYQTVSEMRTDLESLKREILPSDL